MQRKQFKKLYDTYLPKIYRFIYMRVGQDEEVAEDLTSDVFLKALERMDELDNGKHPGAWLYTVARNRLKNYYRDNKKYVDVDAIAWTLEGEDGKATMEAMGDKHVLTQLLSQLSDENRKIVTMKYIEGWSFKDIGAVLEKSTGAVRVQAHRALRELKESLV